MRLSAGSKGMGAEPASDAEGRAPVVSAPPKTRTASSRCACISWLIAWEPSLKHLSLLALITALVRSLPADTLAFTEKGDNVRNMLNIQTILENKRSLFLIFLLRSTALKCNGH